MTQRIKITGYLPVDDMDPDHIDLNDATGLSTRGYDALTAPDSPESPRLYELEDLDVDVVDS